MNLIMVFLCMVISTGIAAIGSLLLKKSASHFSFRLHALFRNWRLLLGALCYVASASLFVWLLKTTELSLLYPLNALAYLWVAFLSIKYLNERMTALKWIGVLLIMIGVFFVTW